MKTKYITPAKAIHPGEILLDETTEYADLIGKGLDMEPTIWQNLQTLYELNQAKKSQTRK